jgi:predicted dehydrogenase
MGPKTMYNAVIIGMGRISIQHYKCIDYLKKLTLSAIVEIDALKIINIDNKNVPIYQSIEDILYLDSKTTIVSICTDSGNHFEIAKSLVAYNFSVLIEKPVALSLLEIDELNNIYMSSSSKLAVCHQNRFNPSVQRLHKSITKKQLGSLYYGVATVRWNRNQAYYDQAEWRGKWGSDGGALMNQSIHNIDLLLWMMGSPVVEVFGYIDNKDHPSIEVEDMGVALLKFANGSYGIIESSMNTYPENFEETLSIFGEKGSVVLGGKSVNKIAHWNVKDDPIDDLEKFNEEVDSVYGNGHIALYKDFIEAIEQDREPAITLQDGRNAVEVILAIYLSSFEKRPVQLPLPADTSTIMFEGKSFK